MERPAVTRIHGMNLHSLRSWRYCVIKVLAAELRSKNKGVGLDWYSGSAAKSPSPSTQYRQLCRLEFTWY